MEHLAEPAEPCESEILAKNEAREEALKTKAAEETKDEPQLPKLSAADFRAYNSMAEHMEYFVSRPCSYRELVRMRANRNSTIISDNHGRCCIMHA